MFILINWFSVLYFIVTFAKLNGENLQSIKIKSMRVSRFIKIYNVNSIKIETI